MRPGRALAALTVAAWLGLAPAARAEVHDSLPTMLSAWIAIQEDPTPPWEQAWLRYEAVQSSWLDPTLYAGRSPAQKAALIDTALKEGARDFVAQMAQLSDFERGWGADLVAVNDGLRREFGRVPLVELYVAYSMSPAKLAIGELAGRSCICVNARRLLPYRSTPTRVVLARYLFERILPRWQRTGPPTLADRLHLDGLSVWAAGRVLPGVPDEALLEVTPAQMRELESGRRRYAALLLSGLDAHDPQAIRRLFGPEAPAGWPPATGTYVGMLVARDLAQVVGQDKLPSLPHSEYVALAKRSLARLSAD